MSDERKKQLREQLYIAQLLRTYPRRDLAQFTDENDHNPLVLGDCRRCLGSGTRCFHYPDGSHAHDTCDVCNGSGTSFDVESYFPARVANLDPIDVTPNDFGWLKCPRCGVRFLPTDLRVWTGLRHRPCGQKIRVVSDQSSHT